MGAIKVIEKSNHSLRGLGRLPFFESYKKGVTVNECIVLGAEINGDYILAKNRDRPYKPTISVKRVLIESEPDKEELELVYLKDEDTGWCEGMNSAGIAITNASLLVGRDEKEHKIVQNTGKVLKDGKRILKALEYTNIEDVIDSLVNYEGGLTGHSIVTDGKKVYSIESTKKHNTIVKEKDLKEVIIRTNHGHDHKDAGYTEGEDYLSSILRKSQVEDNTKVLDTDNDGDLDVFDLLGKSKFDKNNPNNTVRDTNKMVTASQMALNPNKLEFILRLIPDKTDFLGEIDNTPEGYEPKIKIIIDDRTPNQEN